MIHLLAGILIGIGIGFYGAKYAFDHATEKVAKLMLHGS